MSKDCKFAKEKCYKCGKIGHVKRVCRMKPQESASNKGKKTVKWERGKHSKRANYLQEKEEELCEEVFTMYSIQTAQYPVPPFTQVLLVNECPVKFEVDTGCSVTVLSQVEYGKLEVKEKLPKLKQSSLNLKTYTGQSVNVLGTSKVQVKHN